MLVAGKDLAGAERQLLLQQEGAACLMISLAMQSILKLPSAVAVVCPGASAAGKGGAARDSMRGTAAAGGPAGPGACGSHLGASAARSLASRSRYTSMPLLLDRG